MSLQVGDLITTEKDSGRDVLVQVEGRNKLLGQIGQYRGSRAIKVTKVLSAPAEPVREDPPPPPSGQQLTPPPSAAPGSADRAGGRR
jgi:hypothetical protein